MISTDFSPEYYQEMARAGLREAARRDDLVRRRLYLCGKLVRGAAGPKQKAFHRDPHGGRQLIGGNKTAKTTSGIVEARWWLEGTHPFRKTPPPPVHGRLVCPQLPGPQDKEHPQRDAIKEWLPSYLLRGGSWDSAYSVAGHTVYLENGSYLEILSSDQRTDIHASASRHFVWFDEELPRDIWAENVARLAVGDWIGAWWLTMTPIDGLPWIEQEIYKAGLEGAAPFGVHEVTIWDNAHNLPKGFIEQFSESLLPMEREVRLKGKYGQRSGLVYDLFSSAHLAEFGIERDDEA